MPKEFRFDDLDLREEPEGRERTPATAPNTDLKCTQYSFGCTTACNGAPLTGGCCV